MGGFSVDCGFNGVRSGFVRVSSKGSPSIPGISMVNLMCRSKQLVCFLSLLA